MQYTPILKDKPAEMKALTLIGKPTMIGFHRLWPMIEMIAPDEEVDIKRDLDKIDRALAAFPGGRSMVDLNALDDAFPGATVTDLPSTYSPLNYLGVKAAGAWVLTPVVYLTSTPTMVHDAAVEAGRHKDGIAIRVFFEDMEEPAFATALDSLVTALGVPHADIHIILDAASIPVMSVGALSMALFGTLSTFPHLKHWASITIAGSGYPPSSPSVAAGPGGIARIPRTEWQLYKRLVARFTDLELNFGDYGIDPPDFAPDPNARAVSNLRYTTDDEWMFVKGKLITRGGADYFRDVCRIMIAQPEYMSPTYSWGDEYIDVCGSGGGGTGNATTWRQVAITHHITFVLDQIARLGTGAAATAPGP